ncbi:MAG: FAD-binding oxidoreductase [Desulfobacterales bacterium]
MTFNRVSKEDLDFLTNLLGADRVSTGESNLALHSADQAHHKGYLPEVVVWPVSIEEVSAILKAANDRLIPVTPWGAGTSLEGNCLPTAGGIVVDFQRMNKIVAIRPADFQVDVQPGVTYKDMNRVLARDGLFFPPDPGANATIGGMVGNNASGIRTIKYGSTKDNVLRLEAVLPNGQVMHAGTQSHKSSSGYDLVRLLVGSEGTLALITGITLKLSGIPEEYSAGIATFKEVEDATGSVHEIMAYGLVPAALELLDAEAIRYINKDGMITLNEKPTLFLEFTGSNRESLAEDLKQAQEVCRNHGCIGFQVGVGRNERNRLWEARHGFGESFIRGNPGLGVLIIDTACPLSQFSDMVKYATRTAADYGLKACISSHAGDGNLHLNIAGNMQDEEFVERLDRAYDRIVSYAISKGGTATGEHGIGIGKRKFMQQEHGLGVEIMRSIKKCFDPNGILNPGKIFP